MPFPVLTVERLLLSRITSKSSHEIKLGIDWKDAYLCSRKNAVEKPRNGECRMRIELSDNCLQGIIKP